MHHAAIEKQIPLNWMFWPLARAFVLVLVVLQSPQGSSQDFPSDQASIQALKKIQTDYREHLKKRERILQDYRTVEETIKQTEEDFQRIGSDVVRNQLLAMQSAMQSQQIVEALRDIPNQQNYLRTLPRGNSSRTRLEIGRVQNRLVKGKANTDLYSAIKQEELRQLDAASQQTVKRRIESIQSGMNLQNEWLSWQQDWNRFMGLYWAYSDPERKCNRSEIESRLSVLLQSDPEDYPAMLTSALLLERLERYPEGLELTDKTLGVGTALDSTAWYIKSLLLDAEGKSKEAKQAFQNGFKVDSKSPMNQWIRSMIASSRHQWGSAESELKLLVDVKPMELEARRSLSLIHSARAGKSTSEAAKAIKEATLAFDLEPSHDWFSHFVLSVAHHSNGNTQEAIKQLEKAEEKATEDELGICRNLRESVENKRPFAWDFRRGCLARPSP